MIEITEEILSDARLRNQLGYCLYVWSGRVIPLDSVCDGSYLADFEKELNT